MKEVKNYLPPYWDGVINTKHRISSSRFLLSYCLNTAGSQDLPTSLIPSNSPSNDIFWENWYLGKLRAFKTLSDREVKVHVYWLDGNLRCDWTIKPRAILYLKQFNLYLEEHHPDTNTNHVYICGPTVISKTATSLSVVPTFPTRPESKKNLTRFRGKYLLLTYSKLPKDFVDTLFLNSAGNRKSSDEIKTFLKSSHGWDKSLHLDLKSLVVSREIHKDGTPHIHIHVNIPHLPRSVNANSFDIWTGSDWSHPNTQSSKSLPIAGITYVIKDGDFIADSSLLIVNTPPLGHRCLTTELYVKYLAKHSGVEEAEVFYETNDPEGYLRNWSKIRLELADLRISHISKIIDSKRSVFDKDGPEFTPLNNSQNYRLLINWLHKINRIKDWWGHSMQDSIPSSLILLGPPNIGKGEFIRANLDKFICEGSVVWAQAKEDLERVKPYRTKIVVFDDINWRTKGVFAENESSASRLLSTIDDRTIERRNNSKGYFLPERTLIIVISNPNKLPNFMGGELNTEDSRKLTPKEIFYIKENPELYNIRTFSKGTHSNNSKTKKNNPPYELIDLPPEMHAKAGYCESPDLLYVPIDIHPKRSHILRFGSDDILFKVSKSGKPRRRWYDTPSSEYSKDAYFTWLKETDSRLLLEKFGRLYPSPDVNWDAMHNWAGPDTNFGRAVLREYKKFHQDPYIHNDNSKILTKTPMEMGVWDTEDSKDTKD